MSSTIIKEQIIMNDTAVISGVKSSSTVRDVFEISALIVLFSAAYLSFKSVFTSKEFTTKWAITSQTGSDIACKVISGLFATFCASFGLTIFLFWELETGGKIGMLSPSVYHLYLVGAAYFLYDTFAMYDVNNTDIKAFIREKPLIICHHLALSFIFIPLLMTFDRHDPGELLIAVSLCMESSTPFVSLRFILSALHLKKSKAYLINGLCMVCTFAACRIGVYPFFYWKYANLRGVGVAEAVARTPLHCHVLIAAVLVPQFYWWGLMVKGALKVVKDKDS